jgi:hypothetical protein
VTVVVAYQTQGRGAQPELNLFPYVALSPILGNQDKLVQVMTALLTNALNYTLIGQVQVRS